MPSPAENSAANDVKATVFANEQKAKILAWAIFQVALPTFLILLVWPGLWILGQDNGFRIAIGNGDLYPLASLLLLGTVVDLEHESRVYELNAISIVAYRYTGLFFAAIFLCLFSFIKAAVLDPSESLPQKSIIFFDMQVSRYLVVGIFSVFCLGIGIVLSYASRVRLIKEVLRKY